MNKIRLIDRKVSGKRIHQLRKEKNMTQYALAKKLGISRSTISAWENGESLPELSHLKYMSRFFGVPIDYIIGGSDIRYNIKTHNYFEFDLTTLDNEDVYLLHKFYQFLKSSEKYKKRLEE